MINGIDLSQVNVGDIIILSHADAEILLREGWAERIADPAREGKRFRSKRR